MKNNIIIIGLLTLAIAGCRSGRNSETGSDEKPNILLILVDDLRPELNCYGGISGFHQGLYPAGSVRTVQEHPDDGNEA